MVLIVRADTSVTVPTLAVAPVAIPSSFILSLVLINPFKIEEATADDAFELNVFQSVELNAPLIVLLAVGIFNVITGVVVLVATADVISVPEVVIDNAATLVTVPGESHKNVVPLNRK